MYFPLSFLSLWHSHLSLSRAFARNSRIFACYDQTFCIHGRSFLFLAYSQHVWWITSDKFNRKSKNETTKTRHCKNGVTSILSMGKIVFCIFAGDFLNLFWPQALKFMQKRVFLKNGSRYDAHFNRTRTGGGCIRFNYIERLWGRGDFLPWVSNTSTPYISLVYLYFPCSLVYFLSTFNKSIQNSNVLQ